MTVPLFITIALIGLIVGILSGMFGIGGGVLIIPTLNLIFRLPPLNSAATSLFVIAPTAISGAYRHFRQGDIDIKTALIIGSFGALASTVSSFFSDRIPDIVLIVISACIIIYCAATMMRSALKPGTDEEGRASKKRHLGPTALMVARIGAGLIAGSAAGIVGLGGGFIIVPLAIILFGYSFKQATAVSLLAIAVIAIPGIITHAILGHVYYLYGLALIIGTIPGANIGVRLIAKIPERQARFSFGVLLVFSGLILVISKLLSGE